MNTMHPVFHCRLVITWFALILASRTASAASDILAAGRLGVATNKIVALDLQSGQVAHLIVEQPDSDLVAEIRSPDGKRIAQFDSFERGPEPVSFVAELSGRHTVNIACVGRCRPSTKFIVRLVAVREPTAEDLDRVRAVSLTTKANRELQRGTADLRLEADGLLKEAGRLWGALKVPEFEFRVFRMRGQVQYSNGDYKDAQELFKAALHISRALHDSDEAEILNDLGLCQWRMGDTAEALASLSNARQIYARRQERTESEAAALANLGRVHCQTGDCNRAIYLYRDALLIVRNLQLPRVEAMCLQGLAVAYRELGDFDSAVRYLERSLLRSRAANDRLGEGEALMNVGEIRLQQGKIPQARTLLQQAYRVLTITPDGRTLAQVTADLCKAHSAAGNSWEAIDLCEDAVRRYRQVGDRAGEATALRYLGSVYVALGQEQEALKPLASALEIWRSVGSPNDQAQTLTMMASTWLRLGNLEEAEHQASESIGLLESVRAKVIAERLKIAYFSSIQAAYELYVDILMRRDQLAPGKGFGVKAFEIADHRRARSLLDVLDQERIGIQESASQEDRRRLRQLRRRLDLLLEKDVEWQAVRSAVTRQERSHEITELLGEYDLLEAKLREKDPRYRSVARPEPPKLDEIQRQLDADTLLVEFFLGPIKSYAWIVGTNEFTTVELADRKAIESRVQIVNKLIAKGRLDNANDVATLKRVLTALGDQTMAPLATHLRYRRLVFVGDGSLQNVPWAAIRLGTSGARPLNAEHEVISLPSASVLLALRRERALVPSVDSVAIFADPVFDALDPRVRRNSNESTIAPQTEPASFRASSLRRLPFSREEAANIKALLPANEGLFANGFQATKLRLMAPDVSTYRYLHIATHAVVDSVHPELSGIFLSQVDEHGRTRDGTVSLLDVYRLHLTADLVVLSACQTAVGNEVRGEGTVGLARGFLYAGARSVILTLWPVEDEATAAFMAVFYKNLLGEVRKRPAAALRAAQQFMREHRRWGDPYFWAGFELVGDW